jgi:hypothetical protein
MADFLLRSRNLKYICTHIDYRNGFAFCRCVRLLSDTTEFKKRGKGSELEPFRVSLPVADVRGPLANLR